MQGREDVIRGSSSKVLPTVVFGIAVASEPSASHAVDLDLEVIVTRRRTILVWFTLCAVFPALTGRDFEVFRRVIRVTTASSQSLDFHIVRLGSRVSPQWLVGHLFQREPDVRPCDSSSTSRRFGTRYRNWSLDPEGTNIAWFEASTPPVRFLPFRRNKLVRSFRAGLPRRHLPLSGFLTLSAV